MPRISPLTAVKRKRWPGDDVSLARLDIELRHPECPGERIIVEAVYELVGYCEDCGQPVYTGNLARRSRADANTFHTCLCTQIRSAAASQLPGVA